MKLNWKGNGVGEVISDRMQAASVITYLIISNKGAADATINLYIRNNENGIDYLISPKDIVLEPSNSYTDREMVVMEREQIVIQSTGEVDYYFSIIDDR